MDSSDEAAEGTRSCYGRLALRARKLCALEPPSPQSSQPAIALALADADHFVQARLACGAPSPVLPRQEAPAAPAAELWR